jgi:integrase
MPRKSVSGLEHVKAVKRGKRTYLYFNTGQKVAGRVVYTPLGQAGSRDLGTRYQTALGNRKKRANTAPVMMVPELARSWERSHQFTRRSQGTQRTYGVYIRRIEHAFNNAPADDVTPRDIYALLDQMAETPGAAEMALLVARQMFKWGKKRHYIKADPTENVEVERDRGEYEPWPEHVVEEALADAKVRLPVALLYFSGQRIGDVCALRWSDVRNGTIYVTQQKTGKDLEIPVHSRLAEILAEAPRKGLTILTDPNGRKAKDQTIRWHLKAFGRARGLAIVPHGLRKNAVNALLEADCSVGQVSSITGQSLQMVEHYAKRRNNPRMAKAAILKWERTGHGETLGKIGSERP